MCSHLVCFPVNLPLTSMQLPPQSSTKERFSDVMSPPSFKSLLWDWGKFYNYKSSMEHKFIIERVINSTHLDKLYVYKTASVMLLCRLRDASVHCEHEGAYYSCFLSTF